MTKAAERRERERRSRMKVDFALWFHRFPDSLATSRAKLEQERALIEEKLAVISEIEAGEFTRSEKRRFRAHREYDEREASK